MDSIQAFFVCGILEEEDVPLHLTWESVLCEQSYVALGVSCYFFCHLCSKEFVILWESPKVLLSTEKKAEETEKFVEENL